MLPVAQRVLGQLLPALDEQHAGVADLAVTLLVDVEALLEVGLVARAVGEARTGRLGAADAAARQTAVRLRLVEAKHRRPNSDVRVQMSRTVSIVVKNDIRGKTYPTD